MRVCVCASVVVVRDAVVGAAHTENNRRRRRGFGANEYGDRSRRSREMNESNEPGRERRVYDSPPVHGSQ